MTLPALKTKIQGPIAVIGDVHGQVDKLQVILEKLKKLPDYQQRWIVFIGDFVDRGPDSKGAVELFLDLAKVQLAECGSKVDPIVKLIICPLCPQ